MSYDIHGNLTNRDIHGNAMDRNVHGNRPTDVHGNNWDGSNYGGSWGGGSSSGFGGGASFGSSRGGSGTVGGGGWILWVVALVATYWALVQLGTGMGAVNERLGLEGGWTLAFWIPVFAALARVFPRLVGLALMWVFGLGSGVAALYSVVIAFVDVSLVAGPLVLLAITLAGAFGGFKLRAWGQARAARRRTS